MLSAEEIDTYLAPMTEEQVASIRAIRSLILGRVPDLVEEIDTGKWFGGLLTYHSSDKVFVFALGPLSAGKTTLHSMAYYCSKDLQERFGASLKKITSGKSCFKFKTHTDFPEDALLGLIDSTPKFLVVARETFAKRKK